MWEKHKPETRVSERHKPGFWVWQNERVSPGPGFSKTRVSISIPSHDLNPVDYKIWERVYRSRIRDVDPLKSHLIKSENISTRCSSMKRSGSGVHVF